MIKVVLLPLIGTVKLVTGKGKTNNQAEEVFTMSWSYFTLRHLELGAFGRKAFKCQRQASFSFDTMTYHCRP